MNSKLEKYINFNNQKVKKRLAKKQYDLSASDKEIINKIIILAKRNPELFMERKDEFNKIIVDILKNSKKKMLDN